MRIGFGIQSASMPIRPRDCTDVGESVTQRSTNRSRTRRARARPGEPRGGVRDGVVDEPRRLPPPAQETRQDAGLDPDRIEGHAAAHLTALRAPEVEGIEAAPDLLRVSQEPFRETCDAADLRGERRDEPDRLWSHGRLSRPAAP